MATLIAGYVAYAQDEVFALQQRELVASAFISTPEGPVNPTHVVRGRITSMTGFHPAAENEMLIAYQAHVELSNGDDIVLGSFISDEAHAVEVLNEFLCSANAKVRAYWV